MPSLITIGFLTASSKEARDKVLAELAKVSAYAKENEPGVVRHCITIPRDCTDEKTIVALEEYADEQAMANHMTTPAVVDLLKYFGSDGTLFGGPPVVITLPASINFTREVTTSHEDPYIVCSEYEYKPGSTGDALGGWNEVAYSANGKQPGTLSYQILADHTNHCVRTVEVYESRKQGYEVHLWSESVAVKDKKGSELGTGKSKVVPLKKVAGYLLKGRDTAVLAKI